MNPHKVDVQVTLTISVRSPQELTSKELRAVAKAALSLSPTPFFIGGLTDYPVEVFVTALETEPVR